jgi:hypothetical protein
LVFSSAVWLRCPVGRWEQVVDLAVDDPSKGAAVGLDHPPC